MKRKFRLILLVNLAALIAIYLTNASWLAPLATDGPTLVSHRGVYQTYHRENLERDTCTAIRIDPPEHPYLENTQPSMEAAFTAGADIVEIDIHPTIDGEFAVFHDWTLDCRTEGSGTTREQTMNYLRSLDLGYGYTHDGGQTYPFRGQARGQMMTLEEVYRAFPSKAFLLNIKSQNANEANLLHDYLQARNLPIDSRLMAYGHHLPMERLRQLEPDALLFSRQSVKLCLIRYLLVGWSGYVPEACRDGAAIVPDSLAWAAWGWPNRLQQRLHDAGSLVFSIKDHHNGLTGVYRPEQLDYLPADFRGALWVEKIEEIGPYAQAKFSGDRAALAESNNQPAARPHQ